MSVTAFLLSCVTDVSFLAVFLAVFLLVVYVRGRSSSGPLPPGPPRYPLLGSYLSLRGSANPFAQVEPLAERYGDIMYLQLFSSPVLVLSGYDTIHDALVKHADQFSDRPDFTGTAALAERYGKGIVWYNGSTWRELRKFAQQGMRELGVGKEGVEGKIREEVTSFISALQQYEGQPVDFKPLAMKAVNNVICSICFGRRFEYDDPLMSKILALFDEMFKPQPFLAVLANMFPWLSVLPPVKKAGEVMFGRVEAVFDFLRDRISEREDSFDGGIIRDFVDLYHAKRQDDTHNLCEKNLICTITDLFGAGAETTSTSLTWHVLYMLYNPEVMTRCQHDIDTVVGRGRPVRLSDKAKLPYVEATIMEVLRLSNIALLSLPHALNQGGEFRGYHLPPCTLVLANLKSVHLQADRWQHPHLFLPQRFMLQDGTVNRTLPLVAFGMGPRTCAGEVLAKQNLFLFFSNLLQRFSFRPATSSQLPPLKGILGITYSPEPFEVRVVPR